MDVTYPATFRDSLGEVHTSIHNDGTSLSMKVRGITFTGSDFDALEAPEEIDVANLSHFRLHSNCLCSCFIDLQIPIPVLTRNAIENGLLFARIELGDLRPDGGLNGERVGLELRFGDDSFTSKGTSGWFEGELLDIKNQLPDDTFMRACIDCAFSDYHPAGSGMFGCMACFRDNKEAYLSVQSKLDIFRIWDTMTEWVQETYQCPEFQRRTPGTGYRG